MARNIRQSTAGQPMPLQLAPAAKIHSFALQPGKPAKIRFVGGSEATTACIRCPDRPCIQYSDSESLAFADFAHDLSVDVCSVRAISWDISAGQPSIDPDKCIGCGVCAVRCPVQAISILPGSAAVAAGNAPSKHFVESRSEADHIAARAQLSTVPVEGTFGLANDYYVGPLMEKLRARREDSPHLRPNVLTRNLLRAIGVEAHAQRQGAQFNTIDLLIRPKVGWIVGEVEFGMSAVDCPRDLAADAAILISRHGVDRSAVGALAVLLELPNKREEYWQLVTDMEQVLGLKIRTVTVGVLMLLAWHRRVIELRDDIFYLNEKQHSLRHSLGKHGIAVGLRDRASPAIEPTK